MPKRGCQQQAVLSAVCTSAQLQQSLGPVWAAAIPVRVWGAAARAAQHAANWSTGKDSCLLPAALAERWWAPAASLATAWRCLGSYQTQSSPPFSHIAGAERCQQQHLDQCPLHATSQHASASGQPLQQAGLQAGHIKVNSRASRVHQERARRPQHLVVRPVQGVHVVERPSQSLQHLVPLHLHPVPGKANHAGVGRQPHDARVQVEQQIALATACCMSAKAYSGLPRDAHVQIEQQGALATSGFGSARADCCKISIRCPCSG